MSSLRLRELCCESFIRSHNISSIFDNGSVTALGCSVILSEVTQVHGLLSAFSISIKTYPLLISTTIYPFRVLTTRFVICTTGLLLCGWGLSNWIIWIVILFIAWKEEREIEGAKFSKHNSQSKTVVQRWQKSEAKIGWESRLLSVGCWACISNVGLVLNTFGCRVGWTTVAKQSSDTMLHYRWLLALAPQWHMGDKTNLASNPSQLTKYELHCCLPSYRCLMFVMSNITLTEGINKQKLRPHTWRLILTPIWSIEESGLTGRGTQRNNAGDAQV